MDKMIITISREYGSGGRIIAEQLADEIKLPYYDKKILTRAADDSGFSEDAFEEAEDHTPSSLLYSLSTGAGLASAGIYGAVGLPLGDQLFLAQFDAIRQIASEGSCVIVGRCADYILKTVTGCLNIFIHAELSSRIARVTEEYSITPKEAEARIQKIDKRRAAYYNHYTTEKWGMAKNYHLSIDSGALGLKQTVSLIRAYMAVHPTYNGYTS